MIRRILTGIALIGLAATARAADKPATTKPAATKPAATRPARPPDVLTGPVDPYQPGTERAKFFQAAGVDNELDQKEHAAARGKAGSFVRRFDLLGEMARFDKDGNKTLDWFEADAYRQDLRKRVLAAFDTNKDGRLTGTERDKANAMLAGGRVPGAAAGRPGGRPGATRDREWIRQRMQRRRAELVRRYDTDSNGRIDEAERKAMVAAIRQEAERELAERRRGSWDADKDGQLSDAERAAMAAAVAERQAERDKWLEDVRLRRWDRDGDGQLDETELAAMEAEQARQRAEGERWREEWERKQYDLNDDGKLDDQEQVMLAAARARREAYARQREADFERRRGEDRWREVTTRWRLQNFDLDGDGELDQREREEFRGFERQLQGVGENFRKRFEDRNGDGEVTQEERAANRDEWRKAGWRIFATGFRYVDADGDGQVSVEERRGFGRRMQEGTIRWMVDFGDRFDANRDRRLDARERADMIEGLHKEVDTRTRRFDADRDGRLNANETIDMMEAFLREIGIRPINDDEDIPREGPRDRRRPPGR